MSMLVLASNLTTNAVFDDGQLTSDGNKYVMLTGDLGGGTVTIYAQEPNGSNIVLLSIGTAGVIVLGANYFPGTNGMIISGELTVATVPNINVWVSS